MKEVDWDILADLFEKALDVSPEERAAFLEKACKGKEDLRMELDSLLANFEEAPAFFGTLGNAIPSLLIEEPPDKEAEVKEPAEKEQLIDPHNFVGKQVKNYKITSVLGIGGMGVVYRAEDVELHRQVALKFLPPSLSNDKNARERFITEARAASGLDQANICTIHEIGRTDEGMIFIAMAYYKGETLKHVIAEDNIPSSQAINYAIQICRGLCKAHKNNIVHRDIKPANIMVTHDGVVKILDFGLAKIANQQLTQTGQTMGTVSYMSPEQARGDTTDHRTDIWSLGVLLYEMITGQRPFKGDYAQSTIYSILNEEPDPVADLNANVSQTTAAIISRCLNKNPDERYQTSDALLQALDSALNPPALEQKSVQNSEKNQESFKHYYLVGLVAIVLLGLVIAIPALRQKITGSSSTEGASDAEMRLAILPFQGLPEADEENQVLAAGLMQVVATLLPKLDSPEKPLWVVPIREVSRSGAKTAGMASDFLAANRAIDGKIQKLGNVVSLSLNLIDTRNEKLLGAETSLLEESTIRDSSGTSFHGQIVESLASLLGVEITEEARRNIERALPADPDAYAFYVQGLGYLERFDKEGYIEIAMGQFQRSITADSLFAPSHAGLCQANWEMYRKTGDEAFANQALSSCNTAAALSQDDPAVLTSLGSLLLRTGEIDLAERALRRAIELDSKNPDAYGWLGRVFEHRAIPDSASTQYLKAIALKPNRWTFYKELGIFHHLQGNIEEAAVQFENVMKLTPDNYLAYSHLAIEKQYLYEVDEAERLFLKAIALNNDAVEPRRNLGRIYFTQHRYDEAIVILKEAVALDDFVARSYLGHALYWGGDKAQAQIVWEEVVDIARARFRLGSIDGADQTLLADALIALDRVEEAAPEIEKTKSFVKEYPALIPSYLGRIYERLGERTIALGYLEDAFEARVDFYLIDQDPWLEDLRTDVRYIALRNTYNPNK